MNKLKMPALTATAAALVGTGALAAAPSAPAMATLRQALCAEVSSEINYYVQRRDELEEIYGPNYWLAKHYDSLASASDELYNQMC